MFPGQTEYGTCGNISRSAVIQHAKNKAYAIKILEFLSENSTQRIYADDFGYPITSGVKWHPLARNWGKFKANSLNLNQI